MLNLTGPPLVRIISDVLNDFRICDDPDASIAPGDHTEFILEFSPTRPGVQPATIEILSNDTDEAVYRFDIRAEGAE